MQINDKVYRRAAPGIKPGIIVARKWVFTPLPSRRYVVKDVAGADGIMGIITSAFYGPAEELHYCDSNDLIIMPAVDYEPATEAA